MSLVKLLPAWLHAIADYAVGLLLIAVALTVDMTGPARVAGIVVGATVLAVSMLTKYPLGVVKVLPFKVHSAGDYAAALLLFLAPFALRFNTDDVGVTFFYIGAGVAVLAVSLITNYQYGPTAAPAHAVKTSVADVVADTAPGRKPVARTAPARTAPARTPRVRRTEPLRAEGR